MDLRIAAVLALLLLAGCAGDAPTAPEGAPAAPAASRQGLHGLAVLTTAPGNAMSHDVWANGTVAFQESCNTGGCGVDRSKVFRPLDISSHLPAGVPVRVEAELVYEPHPLYGSQWDVALVAPESSVYSYTRTVEGGVATFNATVLAQGTVQVLMSIYQPGGGLPDTPYTLRIRVSTDPATLLPSVPVAIELGPGDNVSAEVPYLLFGPDGTRVGRFFKLHTIPEGAPSGQYVLLLPPDGAPSPVSSDRADAGLRALPLRTEPGPRGTIPQNGAFDEPWDVTGVPLAMGLRIFTEPGAGGQTLLASMGFSAVLEGPEGVVIDTGSFCNPGLCMTLGPLGFQETWATPIGDDRVMAGAYTLHVEGQVTYEAYAQPFAVYVDLDA